MPEKNTTGSWHDATPTFYEALAGAAKCSPADAYEHYNDTVTANERGQAHPVEAFLEDYVTITPASA